MKLLKIYTIGFFMLYVLNVQAQSPKIQSKDDGTYVFCSKSKNMIGLLTKGFLSEDTFFEYYGFRYSRFVANKMLVGGELGRSRFGEWERTTHMGIYSRYYFAEFNRFSYYFDAQYLFGYRTYDNNRTASNWTGRTNNFAANMGIAYTGFYKKRFGLEFFTGYAFNTLHIGNHPTLGEYNWSKSDIGYGFQINYHF